MASNPTDFIARNNLVPLVGVILVGAVMFLKQAPWSSTEVVSALEQRERSNHESESKEIEGLKTETRRRADNQAEALKDLEGELDKVARELRDKYEGALGDERELRGTVVEMQRSRK